jgi:hypothetical protein
VRNALTFTLDYILRISASWNRRSLECFEARANSFFEEADDFRLRVIRVILFLRGIIIIIIFLRAGIFFFFARIFFSHYIFFQQFSSLQDAGGPVFHLGPERVSFHPKQTQLYQHKSVTHPSRAPILTT